MWLNATIVDDVGRKINSDTCSGGVTKGFTVKEQCLSLNQTPVLKQLVTGCLLWDQEEKAKLQNDKVLTLTCWWLLVRVILRAALCLMLTPHFPQIISSPCRVLSLQASKDPMVVDKIMTDLDENHDGEVDFQEFVVLVAALTVACNEFFIDYDKSCRKCQDAP